MVSKNNKNQLISNGESFSQKLKSMDEKMFQNLSPNDFCKLMSGDKNYKPGDIHKRLFGSRKSSIVKNDITWKELPKGEKVRLDFQAVIAAQTNFFAHIEK